MLVYAMLGQVGGWLLGPALGYRPFSFHIAGTLFGMSMPVSPGFVWTWMFYNFIVFAVVPYLVFRRRYSATQLNLKSVAPRADFRLIVTIALIESAFQLDGLPGSFKAQPTCHRTRGTSRFSGVFLRHRAADDGAGSTRSCYRVI